MVSLPANCLSYCISEFRIAGFNKIEYITFDEIRSALLKLIEIQCNYFSSEVSKMKCPRDIIAFIIRYEGGNKTDAGEISFKKLCKSIFTLAPSLRLSTLADSIFPDNNADISELMLIHDSIQELAQFYGLLLTVKREIARLVVSDEGWYLEITDEVIFERNVRAQIAMKNGALQKYCEDGFVVESFIDTYRKVFGTSEDLVYQQIYSRPFFYNANDLTETQFVRLANGEIPQKGIVDLTDLVINQKTNAYLRGLVLDEENSVLLLSILKPHNRNFRSRFRPIIKINIDGEDKYVTTQDIYYEAIVQLASGQYAHNELPDEWTNIKEFKNAAKDIFKKHSKFLEDNVESILKTEKYCYKRNVTSLSSVPCVKAPVIINGQRLPKKTVGEIDFIIVDDASKTIYVVDAKYLKPTFFYMSFPTDAEKFREENGYEFKLSNKIRWVADNILLLSRQLKRKDILEYDVEGFFITDNLVFYSIISKYPIIPISNFIEYISTRDRFCFLPKISI